MKTRTENFLMTLLTAVFMAIAALFAPASYQADIAKYIADGHALCKVQAAVDELIGGQALVKADAINVDTAAHMRAWRAQHP